MMKLAGSLAQQRSRITAKKRSVSSLLLLLAKNESNLLRISLAGRRSIASGPPGRSVNDDETLSAASPPADGKLAAISVPPPRDAVPRNKILTDGYYETDEYQFLERSSIPSYHFQPSLQRLPIPKLEDSFRRLRTAFRPILTQSQFDVLDRSVTTFQNGNAAQIHKELVAFDKENKETSYISDPWFDMYLKARTPIPVNYNPFMGFAPDPKPEFNDQLLRATNMIISIGRFKRSLDAKVLGPEVFHMNPKNSDTPLFRNVCGNLPARLSWYGAVLFKAFPLDMSQYPNLFNSTRIPWERKDKIERSPGHRHFVVMRKGHFFAVNLFEDDGNLVDPMAIHACLRHILSLELDPPEAPPSTLTALDRGLWAKLRQKIMANDSSRKALVKIDSGLFTLCLDDAAGLDEQNPVPAMRNLLHGDGVNRWFDKSFSLIVGSDGLACINFEHAWGDGVAILRLMEEVQKDSLANHWVNPESNSDQYLLREYFEEIEFPLPKDVANVVKDEREACLKDWNRLDFATVQYSKVNKNDIKQHKLSPDSVMQLAIQIAHYKAYGTSAATYESCSTSAFRKGRTETMRPATSETKRTVQAFLSSAASRPKPRDLKAMMMDCSKLHGQLVKEASMGQGFDRHMMGLRVTAERLGMDTGDMFTNESWTAGNHFVLSTSTLSTETIALGGFGPMVPNGFGIGYNVLKDKLGCTISSYSEHKKANEFALAMTEALDQIYEVLHETATIDQMYSDNTTVRPT